MYPKRFVNYSDQMHHLRYIGTTSSGTLLGLLLLLGEYARDK